MRGFTRWWAGVALAAFCCTALAAYPDKPIRLLVGFTPGGTTDLFARAIADRLTQTIGQSVVVENRSGAGGAIASDMVIRAKPDGYTLLLASSAYVLNAALAEKPTYDAGNALAAVYLIATVPNLVVVHPGIPASNLAELIALAKRDPGKYKYGSYGPGSTPHLATELFRARTGVDLLHIPYKGAAPALTALISREIDIVFASTVTAAPHVKSTKARALATTGRQRNTLLPDVPTAGETVPGYEFQFWFGVLAPVGTPPEVIRVLNAESTKATSQSSFRDRFSNEGAEFRGGLAESFQNFLIDESKRWRTEIQALKLKAD
jgi:tripartite-type tricarboxylate transporter receptor subunit TctC